MMMTGQVTMVPGRPQHCGRMARRLRSDHRAILTRMGVDIHREMRQRFDDSSWRRALFIDDRLLALAGVTGSMSSAEGTIWLAISGEAAVCHPTRIARTVKRQLDDIMRVKRRLVTLVLKEDRRGMLFAYFLGFRVESESARDGEQVAVMVLERRG